MCDLKRVLILLFIVTMLAACDGGPGDGGDQNLDANVTATEPAAATTVPTPTPEGTEDPDEGLIFDALTLTRSGGPSHTTQTITVLGNGALLVDGILLGSVAQEVLISLDNQLDAMGFFRLESQYGPGQARQDTFRYVIAVERGGASGQVETVDGFVPTSIQRLIDELSGLTPTGPAPAATDDPAALP